MPWYFIQREIIMDNLMCQNQYARSIKFMCDFKQLPLSLSDLRDLEKKSSFYPYPWLHWWYKVLSFLDNQNFYHISTHMHTYLVINFLFENVFVLSNTHLSFINIGLMFRNPSHNFSTKWCILGHAKISNVIMLVNFFLYKSSWQFLHYSSNLIKLY